MQAILLTILGAVLVDNFILARFLGICPFIGVSKKSDTALGMGLAVIFVMTIANASTWFINHALLVPYKIEYLQTLSFILVIAALVQMVEMMMKKVSPALYQALGIFLPLITTNCAVLGCVLLSVKAQQDFVTSIIYGASSAVGFTLALLLLASIRERLALAPIPKVLQGVPIALLTASILSLAFMGFAGMGK
ncbi:MAG: electron transport complex subunit RsxA [Fibrobacteres bacterium]|nr:electron transport complex subunit RsxA [Fibrobacterota bacterium]